MKKTFRRLIALAVTLALTAALLLTGCSPSRSASGTPHLTKAYFEKHTAEVMKNSLDPAVIFPITENPFAVFMHDSDSASVLMSFDPSSLAGIPAVSSISCAIDESANQGAFQLGLSLNDTPIDAAFYVADNKLMLASDTFFGEGNAYSLTFEDFDTMLAKFEQSNFAKVLGIPTETVKEFCEQYGINNDYLKKASEAIESWNKQAEDMVADYTNRCYTLVEPYYGEITEEKLTLDGKTCDTLALHVTVNDELIAKALALYADYMRDYQNLYVALYRELLPEAVAAEMLGEMESSIDDTNAQLQESFDAILDTMSFDGTYTYYLAKDTGYLVKCHAAFDLEMDGDKAAAEIDMFFNNGITLSGVVTDEFGEKINIDGGFTFTGTEAVLVINASSETERTETYGFELGFKADKDAGTYRLYATANENGETIIELFEISGDLSYTADSFDMTVSGIRSEGEELPLDIRFAINTDAAITLPANCSELLDLTEDEVYTLIGCVSTGAASLSSLMMGDMSGSLYGEPSYDGEDDYIPMDDGFEYTPLTYDDYADFADYYTYEEFCEFVDTYNELIAGSIE